MNLLKEESILASHKRKDYNFRAHLRYLIKFFFMQIFFHANFAYKDELISSSFKIKVRYFAANLF